MSGKDSKALLEIISISKKFNKIQALKNVNLKLMWNEIRAIVGPNGAGKTTLVNIISGRLKPDSGKIIFRGEDLTGLPPNSIAKKGISYAFQNANVFPSMSLIDNVTLAIQSKYVNMLNSLRPSTLAKFKDKAYELLKMVKLDDRHEAKASSLSHGDLKKLEIAMSLGLNPYLLLLDEPTQGLSYEEIEDLVHLLKMFSNKLTIILVEHNLSFVKEIANEVTVLHLGKVIAEGKPKEVINDVMIKKVYFGGI